MARKIAWTIVALLILYLATSLTPLRYRAVRSDPDFGRIFFPPFFFYVKSFTSGSVGPVATGDKLADLERKIESRYGSFQRDVNCNADRQLQRVTGTDAVTCYTVPARFSNVPIRWVVGHRDSTVTYILVTTDKRMDL